MMSSTKKLALTLTTSRCTAAAPRRAALSTRTNTASAALLAWRTSRRPLVGSTMHRDQLHRPTVNHTDHTVNHNGAHRNLASVATPTNNDIDNDHHAHDTIHNNQPLATTNTTSKPRVENLLLHSSSTDAEQNRRLYDQWAPQYDQDMAQWGYTLPAQVATLVAHYVKPRTNAKYVPHKLTILDAGAGTGLVGKALQRELVASKHNNSTGDDNLFLVGADNSRKMLGVAKSRGIYDALIPLDLNETPFCNNQFGKIFLDSCAAHSLNIFDVVTCVGTTSYVDPFAGTLREFCRWVKPGGFVCVTYRTDTDTSESSFRDQEAVLEHEGVWTLVEQVGPLPYLPQHPDYADKIQVVIRMYQKTGD